MKIELSVEQQLAVQQGQPVEIIDPNTNRAYVITAREASKTGQTSQHESPPVTAEDSNGIPPGILRAQQAFWRDLLELLNSRQNRGKWVGYHGNRRIGIAKSKTELIRTILQQRIPRGEYYVTVIEPCETPPWEPEEIEPLGAHHFEN